MNCSTIDKRVTFLYLTGDDDLLHGFCLFFSSDFLFSPLACEFFLTILIGALVAKIKMPKRKQFVEFMLKVLLYIFKVIEREIDEFINEEGSNPKI